MNWFKGTSIDKCVWVLGSGYILVPAARHDDHITAMM